MKKTEIIDNFMKVNNLSKSEFCKKCGISKEILYKLYKDKFNIKLSSLRKIAKFINVSVITLMEDFD